MRSNSTIATTTPMTTTAAPLETEYEDDEYEEVTTPKPKRRKRPSSSTTTTTTTEAPVTKTLSPGYKNRADGRIIDFMADPNFPYELKGADLTDYPFYIKVPENVQFDCKGRHDGYYANVDFHCQVSTHLEWRQTLLRIPMLTVRTKRSFFHPDLSSLCDWL